MVENQKNSHDKQTQCHFFFSFFFLNDPINYAVNKKGHEQKSDKQKRTDDRKRWLYFLVPGFEVIRNLLISTCRSR